MRESEQFNSGEGEKNNSEIQKVSLEEALSRAVSDRFEEGERSIEEKPGYYTDRTGYPPSHEGGNVVRNKHLKEKYAWLGVDMNEYLEAFRECITNPDKIYELADKSHPSMKRLWIKKTGVDNLRDIPTDRLIGIMLGMEYSLNPAIRFYSSAGDDEAIKKYAEEEVLKDYERNFKPDDDSLPKFVDNNSGLSVAAHKEGISFKNGGGVITLWPPYGFLGSEGRGKDEVAIEDEEQINLDTITEIERIIDKLKENPMISEIYLQAGAIPVPYWKRE